MSDYRDVSLDLERECDRLKSALRMADSVSTVRHPTNTLCVICSKNEAILPSQYNTLSTANDRLTRYKLILVCITVLR